MSLALAGALAVAESAAGQQAPAETPQAPPEAPPADPNPVTPPKLVKFVKIELPEAESPAVTTAVVTELTIDEQGRVAEASVVESAGDAIDRAVLEAVRAFEFEPARQGETPIRVKIRYRYVVEPKGAVDEVPPGPAPVPAPAAPAPVEAQPGGPAGAESPAEGAPKKPEKAPEDRADDELEEFTGTAEVEAPPREATKRTIEKEQLTRIPGTRGDAIKAIEVLPGVARTYGDPLIRGASWNESGTFLDGIPVPFLYHLGGTSFMNSRLLEEVNLYPGNFSTKFGRLTGGIIEVKTAEPRLDGLHGVIDLNVVDSSALVQGPLGEKTGIALAARRSNIDFFFKNFVPDDAYNVLAAPVYWDYQGILSHEIDARHRLKLMAYGGRDTIELLFSNPNDEDPALAGSIGGAIGFHRLQASLRSKLASTATQELTVSGGYIEIDQQFGEMVQEIKGPELYGRGEWGFELLPELRLTTGFDVSSWFAEGRYRGPAPGATEGAPDLPLATQRMISGEADIQVIRPGAYMELGVRPWEPLLIVPGVRADYYEDLDRWSVDPRLSSRYEVTEHTALKAGVGVYSQPPEYWQALELVGNPNLGPYHALHTSAGVEQRIGDHVKFGVEGFYKWLWDRVVPTPGNRPPRFVNEGEGRIIGGEFSAEVTPEEGTFGYLAYTLSQSQRRDLDGRWRLFDDDQTHILTIAASRALGRGWEVGARFRLVSGNPMTPITGSVYDARSGVYVPLFGPINSDRNPTFHQLDLRVEKKFQIGPGSLAVYLDLQNAYNAQNQEGVRYSFDYREQETITGLPLIPNLGLRGEL